MRSVRASLLVAFLSAACTAPLTQPSASPSLVVQVSPSPSGAPLPVASFGPIPSDVTPVPSIALGQIASAAARSTGNNLEAENCARSIHDVNTATRLPSGVHVDLLPGYTGTLSPSQVVAYRMQVRSVAVTVVLFPAGEVEWLGRNSANGRALFMTSLVNTLHNPSDSYPNADARVTYANDRGGVLAIGTYTVASKRTLVGLANP